MEIAPNIFVYFHDILIPFLSLWWLGQALGIRKKIYLPPLSGRISLFVLIALLSLLVGSLKLTFNEGLTSALFLVRLIEYLSLYLIGYDLFRDKKFSERGVKSLILAGFVVAVLGFLQFIVIPDFAQLAESGGWDPHQYRLLSTFFDPYFVGGFLAVTLTYVISYFFFSPRLAEKVGLSLFGVCLVTAIILTFSRSTYLAFFTMLLAFGLLKSRKLFISLIVVLGIVFVTLPPVQSRLVQAINLDDSARARLISWSNAYQIFQDQPLLGVGYNSYRFAQDRYGFLTDFEGGGHSGSGADSSLLLILATTGILGVVSYLAILVGLLQLSFKKRKEMLGLAFLVSTASLLVHSQFVNSLFYPQILAVFWIGAALTVAKETPKDA